MTNTGPDFDLLMARYTVTELMVALARRGVETGTSSPAALLESALRGAFAIQGSRALGLAEVTRALADGIPYALESGRSLDALRLRILGFTTGDSFSVLSEVELLRDVLSIRRRSPAGSEAERTFQKEAIHIVAASHRAARMGWVPVQAHVRALLSIQGTCELVRPAELLRRSGRGRTDSSLLTQWQNKGFVLSVPVRSTKRLVPVFQFTEDLRTYQPLIRKMLEMLQGANGHIRDWPLLEFFCTPNPALGWEPPMALFKSGQVTPTDEVLEQACLRYGFAPFVDVAPLRYGTQTAPAVSQEAPVAWMNKPEPTGDGPRVDFLNAGVALTRFHLSNAAALQPVMQKVATRFGPLFHANTVIPTIILSSSPAGCLRNTLAWAHAPSRTPACPALSALSPSFSASTVRATAQLRLLRLQDTDTEGVPFYRTNDHDLARAWVTTAYASDPGLQGICWTDTFVHAEVYMLFVDRCAGLLESEDDTEPTALASARFYPSLADAALSCGITQWLPPDPGWYETDGSMLGVVGLDWSGSAA